MKLYYEACASLQQVPADTIGGPVTIEGTLATPYVFRPKVGLVTLIGPYGEITSYGCDAFARLISVTDYCRIMERVFNNMIILRIQNMNSGNTKTAIAMSIKKMIMMRRSRLTIFQTNQTALSASTILESSRWSQHDNQSI
jgi:YD repeat-containing protein